MLLIKLHFQSRYHKVVKMVILVEYVESINKVSFYIFSKFDIKCFFSQLCHNRKVESDVVLMIQEVKAGD